MKHVDCVIMAEGKYLSKMPGLFFRKRGCWSLDIEDAVIFKGHVILDSINPRTIDLRGFMDKSLFEVAWIMLSKRLSPKSLTFKVLKPRRLASDDKYNVWTSCFHGFPPENME